MGNKEITAALRLTAMLMELHGENPFKIRGYTSAVLNLEKLEKPINTLSQAEIELIVGKSISGKVLLLLKGEPLPELEKLKSETPEGVIRMTQIKGLGPKKVIALWKEHNIDSPEKLLVACQTNEIAKLKGFGEKSQESIKEAIIFVQSNAGKLLYQEAAAIANEIVEALKHYPETEGIQKIGSLKLQDDVIEKLAFLIPTNAPHLLPYLINGLPFVNQNLAKSGPFKWVGVFVPKGTELEFLFSKPENSLNEAFIHSAAEGHLQKTGTNGSILKVLNKKRFETEQSVYEALQLPYILPEMRQAHSEWDWAAKYKNEDIVSVSDLKGALHNHSTYSDGAHTLLEMAQHCAQMGYQYFGISDHSQTASYAGGLPEEKVQQQHLEIDKLNVQLSPFRIFKGIESDILPDGNLDYPDEVLASFDFIVASVHANLNMDIVKATDRLIKAIANPYTTFLGHPTGRLLIRRNGYPIDHKAIIEACAHYGVIIELNANPWRLDMDWRYIWQAMEAGVMISINPDAHEKVGLNDMYYGICSARKAGLTKDFTFNTKSVEEVAAYFKTRKEKIAKLVAING